MINDDNLMNALSIFFGGNVSNDVGKILLLTHGKEVPEFAVFEGFGEEAELIDLQKWRLVKFIIFFIPFHFFTFLLVLFLYIPKQLPSFSYIYFSRGDTNPK